ncbi:hypothetical protein AKJ16_DCAP16478 [Drosera capensis]
MADEETQQIKPIEIDHIPNIVQQPRSASAHRCLAVCLLTSSHSGMDLKMRASAFLGFRPLSTFAIRVQREAFLKQARMKLRCEPDCQCLTGFWNTRISRWMMDDGCIGLNPGKATEV